jgi:O-antigen/teichoic acid export membrane protein
MAEIFSLFPVALTDSIFPILAKSVGNPAEFDRYLRFSFRALMALVFGICAVAAPLSGPLTKILFGAKYTATAPIFAALIWSEVAVFFGVTMKMAVVSFNHQRFLAISTIIGAIVNIVLNLFWIPRYGALGATWATNISYAVASIFIYLLFAPTRRFAWIGLRISFPAFLLSLTIAGLLMVSPLPIFLNLILGVILYGAGAWVTGLVGREELHRVWRLVTEILPGLRSKAA